MIKESKHYGLIGELVDSRISTSEAFKRYGLSLRDLCSTITSLRKNKIITSKQCGEIYQNIYDDIKKYNLSLAASVEKEMAFFLDHIDNGIQVSLRTNTELALEYGNKVYGKSVTKKCISNILAKYMPQELCELREEELKYQSQYFIRFKSNEDNKINGRKGADKTNELRKLNKCLKSILTEKTESNNL